jgi:hypothetical protein
MLYKPVAASFTMVVELLLLALLYFVVATIYSSAYGDKSILVVATLCVSFMASLTNLLTFIACALYRKSSVVRWYYYQSLTQATFCTIMISSMMYFVGWMMSQLNQSAWQRAFFMHASTSQLLVHDIAGVVTLALHMVLLLVAGLGTYASTPEGSMNLLWFNTPCLVSLCIVWVIMFEVAEFGAMHCYALTDMDRVVVFVVVNSSFSVLFLLHMLDVMNIGNVFGFNLPTWCKHVLPETNTINRQVQWEYRRILDIKTGSDEPSLSSSTTEMVEKELEEAMSENTNAIVHHPILYFWRCLSLTIAFSISLVPVFRIVLSTAKTFESDDEMLILLLSTAIPVVMFSLSVLLCFDYVQLLRPMVEPDRDTTEPIPDTVVHESVGPDERTRVIPFKVNNTRKSKMI